MILSYLFIFKFKQYKTDRNSKSESRLSLGVVVQYTAGPFAARMAGSFHWE